MEFWADLQHDHSLAAWTGYPVNSYWKHWVKLQPDLHLGSSKFCHLVPGAGKHEYSKRESILSMVHIRPGELQWVNLFSNAFYTPGRRRIHLVGVDE